MEFKATPIDIEKNREFHEPQFVKNQLQIKQMSQADLIKALDELTETVGLNAERIRRLNDAINSNLPEEKKLLCQKGIDVYDKLSVLTNKVSEIYVVLLDIYTYGIFCMLARDEWDWRAFARHIYTILYEHPRTVNKQLNEIVRILQLIISETYDLSRLILAKKEFTKLINEILPTAKQIRIKTDAHYDTDFTERLSIIQNLEYYNVIMLFYSYIEKMHHFLKELRPALVRFRRIADVAYHSICLQN